MIVVAAATDPLLGESLRAPALYDLVRTAIAAPVRTSAALRIQLDDPALVPSLLEFLTERVDCVTQQVGEREVEISLLGSYQPDTHDLTVGLLLRAWEAAREIDADRDSQT